ncbi:MAG: hypothetical protein PUG76_06535 [Prevotellaceae bacterium]|nr:hypothetical protein [Prevotellaceae bacterium]
MKKTFKLCLAVLATAFAFTSCEDVPAPYNVPTNPNTPGGGNTETPVPAGEGTQASPYNVAAILPVVNALAADASTETELYVKGVVTSIAANQESAVSTYGNLSYYISDTKEGATNNRIYIFQSLYLNKAKYTSVGQIQVGDTVVVCSKWINYKGNTPETTGRGTAYLVSHNGQGSTPVNPGTEVAPAGDGTQASPYNVAAIIPLVAAMPADQESEQEYYITGTIVGTPSINTSYGNADFNIADPANPGKTFKIFRAMSFEGAKFTNANALKEGDVVVLKGKVVNYKGNTPETAGNKSQLVSVNGKTEFEAGGETPDPGTPATPGLTVNGTQMFLVPEGVEAGTETAVVDLAAQGFANATDVTTVEAEGCTITFGKGTNTSFAPKFYTASKGVRMYANNDVTFTSTKKIASITLQCDSYQGTNYVGNETRTFNVKDNVFTLTNTHTAATGGTQIRIQTVTFTFAK